MNHGDRSYLLILSGVIVLLLAVGILNFINLYMVMLMKRSREYGIKKVLGLGRSSLFVEIWLENFVLVFASLFVAWVLIEVTAVPVERLLGEQIGYTLFDGWLSLGILVALPLLTTLTSSTVIVRLSLPCAMCRYVIPLLHVRYCWVSSMSLRWCSWSCRSISAAISIS